MPVQWSRGRGWWNLPPREPLRADSVRRRLSEAQDLRLRSPGEGEGEGEEEGEGEGEGEREEEGEGEPELCPGPGPGDRALPLSPAPEMD
jgi:hypothetical protein